MVTEKEPYVGIVASFLITLFTLSFPLFLTTCVISAEVNEPRLYYWSVSQPQVLNATGIQQTELEEACRRLIAYFNLEATTPQMEVTKLGNKSLLFNERELIHLEDVRGLVQLNYRVQAASGILVAICLVVLALLTSSPKRSIGVALTSASSLTLILALSLVVASLTKFDQLFWLFHEISFTNLFWQLDPSRDHLIQMFPQHFWYISAMLLFGTVIACSAVVLILGQCLVTSSNRQTAHKYKG